MNDPICAFCGEEKTKNQPKHIAEIIDFVMKKLEEAKEIVASQEPSVVCLHEWISISSPADNRGGQHTDQCMKCGETFSYDTSD